jgi:hypothetical protein
MTSSALSELRLLSGAELDSRSILTTVLAVDLRLADRLEEAQRLPIAGRIRARLCTEALAPSQLLQCLIHQARGLRYLRASFGWPANRTESMSPLSRTYLDEPPEPDKRFAMQIMRIADEQGNRLLPFCD